MEEETITASNTNKGSVYFIKKFTNNRGEICLKCDCPSPGPCKHIKVILLGQEEFEDEIEYDLSAKELSKLRDQLRNQENIKKYIEVHQSIKSEKEKLDREIFTRRNDIRLKNRYADSALFSIITKQRPRADFLEYYEKEKKEYERTCSRSFVSPFKENTQIEETENEAQK